MTASFRPPQPGSRAQCRTNSPGVRPVPVRLAFSILPRLHVVIDGVPNDMERSNARREVVEQPLRERLDRDAIVPVGAALVEVEKFAICHDQAAPGAVPVRGAGRFDAPVMVVDPYPTHLPTIRVLQRLQIPLHLAPL